MNEMFVEFFDAIDDLSDNEMEGTTGMGLGLVIPKLKTDGDLAKGRVTSARPSDSTETVHRKTQGYEWFGEQPTQYERFLQFFLVGDA